MAGRLREDHIRWILSLDAKGVQGELVQVSSTINRLKEENINLKKQMDGVEISFETASKSLQKLEDSGKKNTKQYEIQSKLVKNYSDKIVELSSKIEQNNKSISEERKKFDELNKSLKINDMTMNQLRNRAGDLRTQLNNTSKSAEPETYSKLEKELKKVEKQMGILSGKTKDLCSIINTSWGVIAGNLMTSFIKNIGKYGKEAFNSLISSTKELNDKYQTLMAQSKASTDAFYRSIASGDWSNLLDNMRTAINEAKEYSTIMAEISTNRRSAGVAEAKLRAEIAEQKVIIADLTRSDKEREAATQKALDLEKQILDTRISIANVAEDADFKWASKTYNMNENTLRVLTESYHLKDEEINQAKKLIELEKNLQKEKAGTKTKVITGSTGAVVSTTIDEEKLKSAQNEYDKAFKNLSDSQKEFAEEFKKYGNVADEVRDRLANSAKEKYNAEAEYNNSIIRLTTKASRFENKRGKELTDLNNKQEKILKDTTAQIEIATKAYNDKLKEAGLFGVELNKLTKDQLDERLKLDKDYQDKLTEIALKGETTRFENAKKDAGVDGDATKFTKQQNQALEILQQQHEANIQKIKDSSAKTQEDLQNNSNSVIFKSLQESQKAQLDVISNTEKAKIIFLQSEVTNGTKTRKQYEKELQEIESDSLAARIIAQEDYIENLKLLTEPSDEQKKELENAEKQLLDLTIQSNNNKLNAQKDFEEKRKAIREQFGLVSAKDKYNAELEALKQAHEQGLISEDEYQRKLKELKLGYAADYANQVGEYAKKGADVIQTFSESETATLDAEYTKRQSALTEQFNQGLISQEEYNAQKEELEYEQRKKELDIQKKYADVNFAMQAAEIISSGAVAAINAFKSLAGIPYVGPALGAAAAGLVAVITAMRLRQAKAERNRVKAMTLESPGGGGGGSSPKTGEIKLKEGFAEGGLNDDLTEGGYTGAGGKYDVAGYVPIHHGEYVIANQELKNPVIMSMARSIERERRKRTTKNAVPGFADGGSNTPDRDSAEIDSNGKIMSMVLAILQRLESGDIVVQTNYGITEMEAEQKRKQESEGKFTKAS